MTPDTSDPDDEGEYAEVIVLHLTADEIDHIKRGGEVAFTTDSESSAEAIVVTDDFGEHGDDDDTYRVDGPLS